MRPLLASLLLCFSSALSASTVHEISSRTLVPARWNRSALRAASNGNGYVATWLDERQANEAITYFARFDAEGKLLDEEPLRLAPEAWYGTAPLVASDGTDYLLLEWGLRTVHVTAAGIKRNEVSAVPEWPRSMAWNGSHYVVIFNNYGRGTYALLLDREGTIASGALSLELWEDQFPVQCRTDGRCLVVAQRYDLTLRKPVIEARFFDESQFPERGLVRSLAVPTVRLGIGVSTAGIDARGLYTVAPKTDGRLSLRRHEWGTGRLHGESLFSAPAVEGPLTMTSDGETVTVAYMTKRRLEWTTLASTVIVRLAPGRAEQTTLPWPASPSEAPELVSSGADTMVFWRDKRGVACPIDRQYGETAQYYAARIGSAEWRAGGVLVTRTRIPAKYPVAVRGTVATLVTWVEIYCSATLYARMIDGEGRPLTPPIVLANTTGHWGPSVAAFDGVNFLVVWQEGFDRLRGRFVSQQGEPVGDPFPIETNAWTEELGTLTWDGSAYIFGSGPLRISTSGAVLETSACGSSSETIFLPRGASQQRTAGLGATYRSSVVSAGPATWVSYYPVTFENGRVIARKDEALHTGWVYVRSAVAEHDGDLFALIYGWQGEVYIGPDEWKELPGRFRWSSYLSAVDVEWSGREWVTTVGDTIARYRRDRSLIEVIPLPGANDSIIADISPDSVLVVMGVAVSPEEPAPQREGVQRIVAKRVDLRKER